MRILAIYRHYWPDATPYARLLRAILEDQVEQGREATVFTAQPGYNDVQFSRQRLREIVGGVEVRRITLLPERKRLRFLRAINYFYFLLRAVLHALSVRRYDVIVANTHPPVMMGIALRLIRRLTGIPFILHCQDIHPESAVLADQLRKGRISQWLEREDTKNCAAAFQVVTLSEDMSRTLQKRKGYTGDNISIVNNFALDVYEPAGSLPASFDNANKTPFRVLFAGNLGLFQDLPRLVEAAHVLCSEPDIHFIFMGAGAQLRTLQQLADDLVGKTVFFEEFQPVEVAFACMQRADLGVVSLRAGTYQVAYPSKTMTYLAAGCPLLLLAESDSKLAEDVVSHEFGYVPEKTTSAGIAESIRQARSERERWSDEARHELTIKSASYFGKERALVSWRELFDQFEESLEGDSLPFPVPEESARKRAA